MAATTTTTTATTTAVAQGPIDLWAPVTSDIILEVRSGKMKNMKGLSVLSGIDKGLCPEPVKVDSMGIAGDEHDYTFHGGVDKAIHGYCCTHYDTWKSEFPTAAERFTPGGFGENLVLARMNERNVCIGDVVAVGGDDDGLLLQVSLPRQPCFKLNHRFELRNFAPNTWRTSRTGWYYRVLRGGTLRAGDEVRLVDRPHPQWTIERIQEYLHRKPDDMAMVEQLAAIDEFGAECRDIFRGRVAKQRARERRAAAAAEGEERRQWRPYRVVEKKAETARIASFVFEAAEPDAEADAEPLDAGSHVKLRLGNGLVRAYSVVGGKTRGRFELGVALDEKSRGGSRYLHERVAVGDLVEVGRFTSDVPFASAASHHEFVAGGVGITAFLPLVEAFKAINYSCRLHYAVRSADDVPFRERLEKLGDGVVVLYDKSKGQRLDIPAVIKGLSWNTHVSFCGPRRLMDEALRETRAAGLAEGDVHFEAFEADTSGDPFEVVVANRSDGGGEDDKENKSSSSDAGGGGGGVLLPVGAEETLLEVLQRRFGTEQVASSCEVGNCGTCKIALRAGRVEHRGTALTEDEKAGAMLSCVSRGVGRIVVEI